MEQAEIARREEMERQARISRGMDRIADIFEGGGGYAGSAYNNPYTGTYAQGPSYTVADFEQELQGPSGGAGAGDTILAQMIEREQEKARAEAERERRSRRKKKDNRRPKRVVKDPSEYDVSGSEYTINPWDTESAARAKARLAEIQRDPTTYHTPNMVASWERALESNQQKKNKHYYDKATKKARAERSGASAKQTEMTEQTINTAAAKLAAQRAAELGGTSVDHYMDARREVTASLQPMMDERSGRMLTDVWDAVDMLNKDYGVRMNVPQQQMLSLDEIGPNATGAKFATKQNPDGSYTFRVIDTGGNDLALGKGEKTLIQRGQTYNPISGEFEAMPQGVIPDEYYANAGDFTLPAGWSGGETWPGGRDYQAGDDDDDRDGGIANMFSGREQAMKDYYLPQLENAANNAREELTYSLARAGLLNSTAAGQRQSDLGQQYALERGSIMSRIAQDISRARSGLNSTRAQIEASLAATGNAEAASNQALNAMATFAQDAPTLNPLGNIFAGIGQGLGAWNNGRQVEEIRRASTTTSPLYGGGAARTVYS